MSESNEQLTGFDLWTPNDYSNFITICAAAVGSTLLVIFKSRCKNIKLCCGIIECIREPLDFSDDDDNKENKDNGNKLVDKKKEQLSSEPEPEINP
tara:strand:+ start:11553 stop:11840 length:288 start_codon:yes stop_codon:yes gene_type:complete